MNDNERRATNEALFRDVNERIAESAERFDSAQAEFVCECSDPYCTERVPVALSVYETVRADPTTFLLAPGHEHADIERVIAKAGRFNIVEKVEAAVRRTVTRLDPRTKPAPNET